MTTARDQRGPSSISGGTGHKVEPTPGTIRTAAIGAEPDTRPLPYPHEALCLHCPQLIRLGAEMPIGPIGLWQHTGMVPGQT